MMVTKSKFYEECGTMKRQGVQEKAKFGCMQKEFVDARVKSSMKD